MGRDIVSKRSVTRPRPDSSKHSLRTVRNAVVASGVYSRSLGGDICIQIEYYSVPNRYIPCTSTLYYPVGPAATPTITGGERVAMHHARATTTTISSILIQLDPMDVGSRRRTGRAAVSCGGSKPPPQRALRPQHGESPCISPGFHTQLRAATGRRYKVAAQSGHCAICC